MRIQRSEHKINHCTSARMGYNFNELIWHLDIIQLDNCNIRLGTSVLVQNKNSTGFYNSKLWIDSTIHLLNTGEQVTKTYFENINSFN